MVGRGLRGVRRRGSELGGEDGRGLRGVRRRGSELGVEFVDGARSWAEKMAEGFVEFVDGAGSGGMSVLGSGSMGFSARLRSGLSEGRSRERESVRRERER